MKITLEKNSYFIDKNLKFKFKNDIKTRIFFKNQKKRKFDKNLFFITQIENDKFKIESLDVEKTFNKEDLEKVLNEKNSCFIVQNNNNNLYYSTSTSKVLEMENFFYFEENELDNVNIKYLYLELVKKLDLKDIYKYSSIFDYVINNGLKKITNKLSFVNKQLDKNFLEVMQSGWGECFKLQENRKDRKILAIDVNSMFPYCMQIPNFIEINKMKMEKGNENSLNNIKNGLNGMSVVKFKLKENISKEDENFINNYNFFQINKEGNKFHFNNFKDLEIETYMLNSEIRELERYFDFEIKEIISSDRNISHYLSNTTKKFYQYRTEEPNNLVKKVIKTMLVAYHSITNKNIMKNEVKIFKNRITCVNYFKHYLKKTEIIDFKTLCFYKQKKLDNLFIRDVEILKDDKIKVSFKTPSINLTTQIYSLPAQIMSNSRIKIFQTIRKIEDFNSSIPNEDKVEICYTNIDSIHLSLKEKDIEKFKKYFNEELGQELGLFKIEGVFDCGLWFDPGRYWLFDREKEQYSLNPGRYWLFDKEKEQYHLKQFKSIIFQDKDPFLIKKSIFIKDKFNSLIKHNHYLFSSTNYNKLFFKRSETNIVLKKIDINKIIKEDFNSFFQLLVLKNYKHKKNSFYYFKNKYFSFLK